jgi:hypothetical protein
MAWSAVSVATLSAASAASAVSAASAARRIIYCFSGSVHQDEYT